MMKMLSALMLFMSISFSLKAQQNFYVSTTGLNTNNGLTPATAWRNIQYAANNPLVVPNSTVHILAGTYNEAISIGVSGDAMGPITFQPYESDVVVIDGTGLVPGTTLLNIENESYVHIRNLRFTGAEGLYASAIYIQGNSSHIVLANNTIDDISGESINGIVVLDASEVDILSNEISDMNEGDYPTAIFILGTAHDIDIAGNRISGIVGNFAAGIYVAGASADINISNNIVSNVNFSSDVMEPVTDETNANPVVIFGDAPFGLDNNSMPTIPPAPITNVSIVGNDVGNCRTGYSEGIAVAGNVDGFLISGNLVYQISNIGIDVIGGYGYSPDPAQDFARNGTITSNHVSQCRSEAGITGAGIYVDGANSILVELNRVHDCDRGYEIGCEVPGWVTSDITLRNNRAWHNDHAGIAIGGYDYSENPVDPLDPGSGKVVSSQVLNNTCYDNSQSLFDEGEMVISYTEDCVVKSNIFFSTNFIGKLIAIVFNRDNEESVNLVMDYNLYYHEYELGPIMGTAFVDFNGIPIPFIDLFEETDQDENSLYADPKFVNAANADFHLGSLSPAFNAGDPTYLPMTGEVQDMDFEERLAFGRVDIGADEASISLPVEYTRALSGRAIQSGIELRWATGIEHNADLFEIQRSADGSVFEKIDAVPTRGSHSAYTSVDKNPLTGANYYRLNQMDLDGRSKLSNVAIVKWEEGTITGVFPNPTADHFEIRNNTGTWEKALLKNALGQTVRSFSTGQETTLSGLETGVYRLEVFVTEDGAPQVFSLVKS